MTHFNAHAPSRRDALKIFGASATLASRPTASTAVDTQSTHDVLEAALARNTASVQSLLARQVTDRASRFLGGVPDPTGLHHASSASGIPEVMAAAFVHPQSPLRGQAPLLERIRLAAGFLERVQSPRGNIDLLTTNFDSPPDTGFVVHNVATAATIGAKHGAPEIARILEPFLRKAAGGMASGGIHTPNHRWVVSAALAQIHALFPDDRYVRRIDEWLAEGIDIDADGQFTERSTLTYNVICDRAFVVLADKLRRPALLDPARRNLKALIYLLHADGEVVTEISRRQDQYTRGGVAGYWFPLTYLALVDRDGQFAALSRRAAVAGARLSEILEYPQLTDALVADALLPEDFERPMPAIGITRVRRGPLSATMILGRSSRLATFRYGDAVVEGVRLASAFFGKGQFVPEVAEKAGTTYVFRQRLEAPYYQPIGQAITSDTWAEIRPRRRQSEVAEMEYSAEISEIPHGLSIRLRASGTTGVPYAIEVAFREGGRLEGCREVEGAPGAYVLPREPVSIARRRARFGLARAVPSTPTFSFAAPNPGCPGRASTSPGSHRSTGRSRSWVSDDYGRHRLTACRSNVGTADQA